MPKQKNTLKAPNWVEGELRLAGTLDSRMIGLLSAINQTGSLNKAAKQMGLSYKGAWQIIERANNGSPKALVITATGGNKGGGTCLTEAGRSLLDLFTDLEQQHQRFLDQVNRKLSENLDTVLLLQRLVVKTSAKNQIFGKVTSIELGAVYAEVTVNLKGGEKIISSISLTSLSELGLKIDSDAVLLINSADIMLIIDSEPTKISARNRLSCSIIRVQEDAVNAEVIVLLPGGVTLVAMITQQSAETMELIPGKPAWALFKSNAPIIGCMPAINSIC